MAASAVSSASMMRRHVHVAAEDTGVVKFSRKVPELIADADLCVEQHCATGTVIVNPRTDRIRKLVVESGGQQLNR